jgi:hypothetical protein
MCFSYLDREHEKDLILLQGWGFLPEIFMNLDLPYNYILSKGAVTPGTKDDLYEFFRKENLTHVSFLAWSMGALLAMDFDMKFPGMADALYLVSVPGSFKTQDIENEIKKIERDKERALKDFYRRCFLGQHKDYSWFKECLEEKFISSLKKDVLQKGLSYLLGKKMDFSLCTSPKIRLFHGTRDIISPIEKISVLPGNIKIDLFERAGHLPFLLPEFTKTFLNFHEKNY